MKKINRLFYRGVWWGLKKNDISKKKRGYPTNVEIHVRKDVKLTY